MVPVSSAGWHSYCPDARKCFAQCNAGDALACYGGALALEAAQEPDPRMYHRACELGIVSGCTNTAAALSREDPVQAACAARTFELACLADDPWACTMFGTHLAEGRGVPVDAKRAITFFAMACGPGESHPACDAARKSQRRVQESLGEGTEGPIDSRAVEPSEPASR